jgi:multiple antibiotic resistance protein
MSLSDFALNTTLLVQAFVTVLVIMDPLGNIPIFLTLTKNGTLERQRAAALQAVTVAAGVILAFALFGQQILHLLGISIQALQVAGGLLLVGVALELLRPAGHGIDEPATSGNIAFVPLGTPLLAGPGAIAATILYMRRAEGIGGNLSVVLALMAALAVVYVVMRYSVVIGRLLKANGIDLMSRVMGLLLAAIAVQLVAGGVAHWVESGV